MQQIEGYDLVKLTQRILPEQSLPTHAFRCCRLCPHQPKGGFNTDPLEVLVDNSREADRVCTGMGGNFGINRLYDTGEGHVDHDSAVIAIKVGSEKISLPCQAFLVSMEPYQIVG